MTFLTDGARQTFGLIASIAGMVLSFYVVVHFTIDIQAIRIVLWVAFAGLMILSIGMYMELLEHYDQTFIKLPSTWMTIGNFVLFVIFSASFGTPWTVSHLNDLAVFMIVVMLVLFVGSLVSNVRRTSLLFGIVLTTIQSLLLPVAVTMCYVLLSLLAGEIDKNDSKV